jgi:Fe-S cluster assembly iron-binding protein IscA
MLDVTQSATKRFAEYFEQQEKVTPIRVFLNEGG